MSVKLLTFAALVSFALVPALAPSASALDFKCLLPPDIELAGQVYLVIDYIDHETKGLFSVWTYLERNGNEGLQRGGVSTLGEPDPCQDSEDPDFLVA